MRRSIFALSLLMLAQAGCYRMTIKSGRTPDQSSRPAYDDKWRSAALLDVVEIDPPVGLDSLCKGTGWATIEQYRSPINWLVDVFLAGALIYESGYATVKCAEKVAPPQPAPAPQPQPPPAPPSDRSL
jgi:hypothetical protein